MKLSKAKYKYYVYRHIRRDKNQPFYIGIGTKLDAFLSKHREFNRAFDKKCRNKIWKRIVNKTDYEVEIIFESNDYSEARDKEKEFIQLYGRLDKDNGILANLTDGGGGICGWERPEEEKERISKNTKQYRPAKYNLDGKLLHVYDSVLEASKEFDVHTACIYSALNGSSDTSCGFQWRKVFDGKAKKKIESIKPLRERATTKGYKRSEETKRKMSIAATGNKCSEETKEKLRKINKGNKISEETKRKLRESAKRGAENHNSKKVKHKETGKVYETITEAAKERGIKMKTLSQRLIRNSEKCKFSYCE